MSFSEKKGKFSFNITMSLVTQTEKKLMHFVYTLDILWIILEFIVIIEVRACYKTKVRLIE